MAFGILVVGMAMGLMAAATVLPADAGFLMIALSYAAVGSLTLLSVAFFAMLCEFLEEESDASEALAARD